MKRIVQGEAPAADAPLCEGALQLRQRLDVTRQGDGIGGIDRGERHALAEPQLRQQFGGLILT